MGSARLVRFVLKPAAFAASLAPFSWLVYAALTGGLGPNPIEAVTHRTGDWTLRFLFLTLAVTPLRALTGWNALVRFRRMLGLFAFFYASLHLLTYAWLDKFFAWSEIARDIPRRPFITMGFFAFVVLVPLALTSTAGMIRRLGGRNWQRLHRLVYASAVAGVVHFWWLVKADVSEPRLYAILLTVLLLSRAAVAARRAGRPSWLADGSRTSTSPTR
jgi:methionine sulfoxide reductase heme-binding subunit